MSDTESTPVDGEFEVIEQEVTVALVHEYDVLAGQVGEVDVVILVLEVNDGTNVATLPLALPSEDATAIGNALRSVASTVRPLSVQTRNLALVAGEENSSK